MQAIASSLFSAESDLVKTCLARSIPLYHVLEADLLRSLCVREYRISGNVVEELRQAELAIVVVL